MKLTDKSIRVIRDVVEHQLAPARIVSVSVSEDDDFDGDPILRIDVVFEIEGDQLDPQKVMGLARHLREPLERLEEDRFPVFSFFKPDEVDGAAA